MDLLIGGGAAVCAGFFTNPLEVMKTRMQLQGELQSKGQHIIHYRNVFHAAYVIAKHDGILTLQAGLVPALWFQMALNGCRLGIYQILDDTGFIRSKEGNLIFTRNVMASGFAGTCGAFCASPLYLIKVHLQAQASQEIAYGYQHKYSGGAFGALASIYQNHGIQGLFRGSTAMIPRTCFGSIAQLTSFIYCKDLLKSWNSNRLQNSPILMTFVASMVGGVVVSFIMTPFDLVATRLYNQGVNGSGKGLLYDGYLDCVRKIWKTERLWGFYKGLGASYFRLGPHTVLCLVFWDYFKTWYTDFTTNHKSD